MISVRVEVMVPARSAATAMSANTSTRFFFFFFFFFGCNNRPPIRTAVVPQSRTPLPFHARPPPLLKMLSTTSLHPTRRLAIQIAAAAFALLACPGAAQLGQASIALYSGTNCAQNTAAAPTVNTVNSGYAKAVGRRWHRRAGCDGTAALNCRRSEHEQRLMRGAPPRVRTTTTATACPLRCSLRPPPLRAFIVSHSLSLQLPVATSSTTANPAT